MIATHQKGKKTLKQFFFSFFWMSLGAFLAAFSLEVFLTPNDIIDGGIVGISYILGNLSDPNFIPLFLLFINLPFVILAYRSIGRIFVIQMMLALMMFAGFIAYFHHSPPFVFEGEMLEVIVVGGLILGMGIGMIIRGGGCLDGTEILAILLHQKTGFTVGQVVLFFNLFIFGTAGFVFGDWHSSIFSFMTFVIAIQIMDKVIVGLEETKSVMIISARSKEIAQSIIHNLGMGLTVVYGRGGFSKEEFEILYVISERLQLSSLKEEVYRIDPQAFIAIENLHEVSFGSSHQNISA